MDDLRATYSEGYDDAIEDVINKFNAFVEIEWDDLFGKALDGDITFLELVNKRIDLCNEFRNELKQLANQKSSGSKR